MSEKKTLNLDVLRGLRPKVVEVEVPEWDCVVRMRVLPADVALGMPERMQAMIAAAEANASEMGVALLASQRMALGSIIVDEGGEPFSDEGIDLLMAQSVETVAMLFEEAVKLQGWKKDQAPEAKNDSSETGAPSVSPTA